MDVRTRRPVDDRAGRAADDAGLDSLFVGDHHNVPVPYYQNVPMLGRLLAEWDDRPARRPLPPAALACRSSWPSRSAPSESLAAGPFIMQCALGGGAEQFDALGVPIRRRPSLFEATLDIVRRLCVGEEVSTDSPYAYRVGPHRADPTAAARSLDRRGRAAGHRPRRPVRRAAPHRS